MGCPERYTLDQKEGPMTYRDIIKYYIDHGKYKTTLLLGTCNFSEEKLIASACIIFSSKLIFHKSLKYPLSTVSCIDVLPKIVVSHITKFEKISKFRFIFLAKLQLLKRIISWGSHKISLLAILISIFKFAHFPNPL